MKPMDERIGVMQGRLSPIVDGVIQCFPWGTWRDEFEWAQEDGWPLIEGTLDVDRLTENPLMTVDGRNDLRTVSRLHGIRMSSLTGDFFMQAPFHRVTGTRREERLTVLKGVVEACAAANVSYLVVPLVDQGRISSPEEERVVLNELSRIEPLAGTCGVGLLFESDYSPEAFDRFLGHLSPEVFGVNYDIGNSAAMGFPFDEEFAAYGERIRNVHVKDRLRAGPTVPLGTGDADLPGALAALETLGYGGDYVIQAARSHDGRDRDIALGYRRQTIEWLGCAK
jgi:L-ribulose-5-phosphate 3-epimerase